MAELTQQLQFKQPQSLIRSSSQFNQGGGFINNRDKNSAAARWKGGSVYSRHQEPVKVFKSSSQNSSGLSNKIISNQYQNAKRYNFQSFKT